MSDETGIRQYKIGIGTLILRPVDFDGGKKRVRGFEPSPLTDRGTFMMRVNHATNSVDLEALWAYSPEGHKINGEPVQRVGLIVFLKEPLLPEWTWIVITGISKTGNAVFGSPVNGDMNELLAKYELRAETKEVKEPKKKK
jgi:hypothetical protein